VIEVEYSGLPASGTTMRLRVPGTGSVLPVRVEKADDRGITVSTEPGYDRAFAPGRDVEVEWSEGGAVNVLRGTVAAAVTEGRRPRIAVRVTQPAERVQRREHVRVRVAVPFTAWTADSSSRGSKGTTIDLSGSGMLATGDLELWPDLEVEIALELPGQEPVDIVAIVARLVKPNAVGFRYTAILPGDRDRLIRFLFKLQQEQLAARGGVRPQ
jgi:c-di-GMP-binding flagellar brake protein YcgR